MDILSVQGTKDDMTSRWVNLEIAQELIMVSMSEAGRSRTVIGQKSAQ